MQRNALLMVSILVFSMVRGDVYGGPYGVSEGGNCGQPLILNKLMETHSVLEAQQAAMVHFPNSQEFHHVRDIQSYSGFFTVNETHDSNVFFWFFPAEINAEDAPLLLWLEGGPGCASTMDVFSSAGPLQVQDDLRLKPGAARWTRIMNVLYLDSPVGAGFSFTKNASGYATTQEDYTRELYSALCQFFRLFPAHRKNDFYVAGIFYAGKYVPALAYDIHEKNPNASTRINLKGIAIGNGLVDPFMQICYSKFLYGVGVIDSETRFQFKKIEQKIKTLILNKDYVSASREIMNSYVFSENKNKSTIVNITGVCLDNFLISNSDSKKDDRIFITKKVIEKAEFRKSIHVGAQEFWVWNMKYNHYLRNDIVQSVARKLERLMDNYRVILYSGQLDIICNYRLMIDYVMNLKWEGAEEYLNATRYQWWVAGELAGYSKTAGNFTEILVRNAGHRVHIDQPSWAFDLLKRLSHNIPF